MKILLISNQTALETKIVFLNAREKRDKLDDQKPNRALK